MMFEGRIRSLCAQVALETNSETFETLLTELTLSLLILRTPATEMAGELLSWTFSSNKINPG